MRIFVGGLKLSYRYFTTHIKASGAQLTLPNINFTLNQLFWILSGQVWCSTHDSGFYYFLYRELLEIGTKIKNSQ